MIVHSSTSNSNHRIPRGTWGRTWLLATVLCAIILVGYEITWRGFGFTPSIRDDPDAWAVTRERVRNDSVVLVGSSRIQADVDPGVWAEAWTEEPLQLAIAGGSPVPVLEELAADRTFGGTVIMDALPRIIFDIGRSRERLVAHWLASYQESVQSPARMTESRLRMVVAGNLVSTRLPPWEFYARSFVRSDPGRVPYVTMEADRFMQLDFQKVDARARIDIIYRQIQEQGEPAKGTEIAAMIRRIDTAVRAIQGRGGNVVLVHFPHNGKIRDLEEELYPRTDYWDAMVSGIDAPAIHCGDEPTLARYSCPDGSHIDLADTQDFTRSLADISYARIADRGSSED
jgi:hypothetical protein